MVLLALRVATNPIDINDVRCPDDSIRETGKENNQQLAEMAGNSAPSFSNVGLYGSETKLQLQFTLLTEEIKVTKVRMVITLNLIR